MFLGGPKDNFVGWGRGVGGRGPRPVFDKSTMINKECPDPASRSAHDKYLPIGISAE